jgi:HAD superfamily hydrolase (TIGR01509 family)
MMRPAGPVGAGLDAVIFDMDGVLCDYDFAARLGHMARLTGRAPADIEAAIFASGWDDRSDRGEIGDEEYLRGCTARLGAEVTREDWLHARGLAMTPKPEVLELARGLAGQVALGVFTNNNELLAANLPALFPAVHEIFAPHVIVSGVLKHAKPDPAAFRHVLEKLGGVAPARALFIDDSAAYLAGAAEAGLHTHLFVDAKDLAATLARHGLG